MRPRSDAAPCWAPASQPQPCRAAPSPPTSHPHRHAHDMTGVYAANTGARTGTRRANGGRGLHARPSNHQGRSRAGRPSAQTRCRARDRGGLVREPGRRRGHRCAAFLGRIRDRRSREAEEQSRSSPAARPPISPAHTAAPTICTAVSNTWSMPHGVVDAAVKEGANTLLHHRRLRIRPLASEGRGELRHRRRRQGTRPGLGAVPRTTHFSSFLVQAQASGAKAIGLANGGNAR